MNKALIAGALGADPELSYTPSGTAKVTLSVATSEKWTDRDGEKQERTDWHRCVAWGKRAEVIAEYFTKGEGIIIEGKVQTRKWETKDGDKRWTTEIIISSFEFLPGKRSSGGASQSSQPNGPNHPPDDDIPF